MERLTEWTEERWIATTKRVNGKLVGDKTIYALCAAYEDTGITPEEVLHLKTAVEQGLLVKLPCKRGDRIWRICGPKKRKFIGERTVLSVAMRDTDEFEIFTNCWDWLGKTVFLTREEAEKALKETARKDIAVNHIQ